MTFRSILAAIIIVSAPVFAQEPPTAPAAAPALDPGLGMFHWSISTKNHAAQSYFDQGMKYVYAFNHEEAIRSFQHAIELDPDLAIGQWGVALALGPNINLDVDPDREKQAYEAVRAAHKLEAKASPKERDLIETLTKRYSRDPNADLKKLSAEYSEGMGVLAKKYPDDVNIATLYAESMMDLRPWKFWSHDGKPAEGTENIVAVLESVLRRDPNHIGANHYYVHITEASPHPERALASADRLRTLAPSAGHLVHMPAHIYQRTGNYAGAAAANERAADVDRQFMKKNGNKSIYALMYYNHNLQFGAASYAMTGEYAAAKRMADEFGSNAAAAAKEMPMLEGAAAASVLMRVRFGRWNEILHMPDPRAGPLSSTLWHFARGVAFAQLGDVAGARDEEIAFAVARAPLTDDPGFMQNSPKAVVDVAENVQAGRIAMAHGDRAAAIAAYRRAVAAEDRLDYDEPSDWFYPTRETLGAALLRNGQPADAEAVFREDLARNPKNPRSLFGLAAALRAQKKPSAKTLAEFQQGWKGGALKVEDM